MTHSLYGGGNHGKQNGFTALGKSIGTPKSSDKDSEYVTEHPILKYFRAKRRHSCGAERPQEGPLSAGEMRRGPAARHRQQARLHQLVGHVLAHRPPQEPKNMMT